MCSGSEAGSYLRLIDFVYHSTLGLRLIKKKKKDVVMMDGPPEYYLICFDLAGDWQVTHPLHRLGCGVQGVGCGVQGVGCGVWGVFYWKPKPESGLDCLLLLLY